MFNTGDIVLYKTVGICKVDGEHKERVNKQIKKYLILKPVYQQGSSVFVPLDNQTLMNRISAPMSKDDIDKLFEENSERPAEWIPNAGERTENFRRIIKDGSRLEVFQMFVLLRAERKRRLSRGKSLHSTDEIFFREARKHIVDEFAYVLDISQSEAEDYIDKKLK